MSRYLEDVKRKHKCAVTIYFSVKDVRVSPALTFEEMSKNSKRYLEASGEWELVDILGETSILQFGIDEWDIITFWVRDKENMHVCLYVLICELHQKGYLKL